MCADEEDSGVNCVKANGWGEQGSFATVQPRLSTVDRDNSGLWRNRHEKESQGANDGKSDTIDDAITLLKNEIIAYA